MLQFTESPQRGHAAGQVDLCCASQYHVKMGVCYMEHGSCSELASNIRLVREGMPLLRFTEVKSIMSCCVDSLKPCDI